MSEHRYHEELLRALEGSDRRKLVRAVARIVRDEERRREVLARLRSADRRGDEG
jgi:hypothetical protein